MKLSQVGSLLLLGASSVFASGNAAVYELNKDIQHDHLVASVHESESYFADKFGVGDYHTLGHGKKSIDLIQKLHSGNSDKPNVVFIVKGVDNPTELFAKGDADNKGDDLSFEISLSKDHDVRKLVSMLFKRFPKEYAQVVNASHVTKVTDEIRLVTPESHDSKSMKHVFKRLHDELPRHWQNFFAGEQSTFDLLTSGLNVLNDKLFISEILQVSTIAEQYSSGLVVASLDSLLSLGTKIGYESSTYQLAKQTLARSIQALSEKFDVTIVAFGPQHKAASLKSRMAKRSQELSEVFAAFTKRGAVTAKSFFSDEDACNSATNKCSGHGSCTEVGSKGWQCACKPTYDKKSSKTTNWAGADCSKKDIAAQANLLLWTSVALLLTLVGGIKLLFSIGNDSLPGVLEAATVKRSS